MSRYDYADEVRHATRTTGIHAHDNDAGEARYVLERLIAEHRITPVEIAWYLAEMGREITDIEARLARLRAASEPPARIPAARPQVQSRRSTPAPARAVRPRGSKKRRGNPLAGSNMGFMRQVRDERKKAEFRKLNEAQGYERAIAAIKQYLGK